MLRPWQLSECGLTLRSSGPPPAWHLGREASQVIVRLAAQAPTRRGPLSSNVRPRARHAFDPVLSIEPGALQSQSVERCAWRSELVAPGQLRRSLLHQNTDVEAAAEERFSLCLCNSQSVVPAPPDEQLAPSASCRRGRKSTDAGCTSKPKSPSTLAEA